MYFIQVNVYSLNKYNKYTKKNQYTSNLNHSDIKCVSYIYKCVYNQYIYIQELVYRRRKKEYSIYVHLFYPSF